MGLIGRKPPTAAELDPFGYWSKPKPAGKWVETFPHLPGNARSEHFVPARPPLRAIEGGRSLLEACVMDKGSEYPKLNRGRLRKAIQLGRIEARWWHRHDDMVDFRRDTNNPWLPARLGTSDEPGYITFEPYWFKERGIRAYKSRADGTYRLAITHNLVLQLREK